MNNNVDIYICAHKLHKMWPDDNVYKIITGPNTDVGETTLNIIYEDGFLSNKGFSELSRYYYVWKNLDIKDYIGFCHYRRYFDFNGDYTLCEVPNISTIFSTHDAILPKPWNIGNVYNNYKQCHNIKDLELCGDIIRDSFKEYYDTFNATLTNGIFFQGNMFILKKEDFEELCRFMFGVMFTFADITGIDKTSDDSFIEHVKQNINDYCVNKYGIGAKVDYQARIFGFLGERLITSFIVNRFKSPKFYNQIDKFLNEDNVYIN